MRWYNGLALIIFFLVLSTIVADYVNNEVSTRSIIVGAMQRKIEELDMQNHILKNEIYHYASYQVIASEAAALGFKDALDYIILK